MMTCCGVESGAIDQIDGYFEYLKQCSAGTADKYRRAFQDAIELYLLHTSTTFEYFWETGAPHRAFCFSAAPRTTHWIYRVYENENLLRVSQGPRRRHSRDLTQGESLIVLRKDLLRLKRLAGRPLQRRAVLSAPIFPLFAHDVEARRWHMRLDRIAGARIFRHFGLAIDPS